VYVLQKTIHSCKGNHYHNLKRARLNGYLICVSCTLRGLPQIESGLKISRFQILNLKNSLRIGEIFILNDYLAIMYFRCLNPIQSLNL